MPVSEAHQWLSQAAAEVLETMFFTTLAEEAAEPGEAEPAEPVAAPCLSVRLSFRGAVSGRLGIRVPPDTGRRIAANFLGIEPAEATGAQIEDVLCELSNMLCGSVLSRLQSESVFELLRPEIGPPEAGWLPDHPVACRTLALEEEGALEVWLETGALHE